MSHLSPLIPHPLAKRGSALLIVLGMTSFLIVSAVAFSVFMRQTRLPSSYLRRATASRLLVKAALAQAIDEIDAAIGNNPHPGIGSNPYQYNEETGVRGSGSSSNGKGGQGGGSAGVSRNRNCWKNRIYIGTNSLSAVDQDTTVSTLTLEGLAYIPPALVNDARYYSRRSKAGWWKTIGFDTGRYAFCAIDVSDYLDVNKLEANVARSGSADRRISLAYLFENKKHTSASGSNGTPDEWDTFMKNFKGENTVPLVSLADFNLALNEKTPNGWTSVFCDYVKNDKQSYYGGISSESEEAEKIRRQMFVTDSYFPDGDEQEESANGKGGQGGQGGDEHIDLDEEENQPFTKSELRGNLSVMQVATCATTLSHTKTLKKLAKCLDPLGLCALYDYLDSNDDPLSLAIPTTERVPMICAVGFSSASAGSIAVEAKVQNNLDNKITPDVTTAKPDQSYNIDLQLKYVIKGLPQVPPEVAVVYPFRHEETQGDSYELGGRVAYFLTMEGAEMGLRTSVNDVLHLSKDELPGLPYKAIQNAVLTVGLRPTDLAPSSFTGAKNGPEKAVRVIQMQPVGMVPTEVPFLDVTYQGQDTFGNDGDGNAVVKADHDRIVLAKGDKVTAATCSWKPLLANGTIAPDFDDARILSTLGSPAFAKNLKLNVAIWLWVKSKKTGRIVDLAPACVYDDGTLNSRNTDTISKNFGQQFLGGAYPVLRFDLASASANTPPLTFASAQAGEKTVLKASNAAQVTLTPQTAMVCDPRFNHAPESWFQTSAKVATWLDNCECGWKTAGGKSSDGTVRDGDIFMSVSDREELQSVFELANILRFTDFYQKSGSTWGHKYANPAVAWTKVSLPDSPTQTANFKFMWRTYDPADGDDFEGPEIHASCAGYKLTPYSTQTNVMQAAFANTPHEWRFSSANEDVMQGIPEDAKGFNATYAWNAYSSGAKIAWEDLEDLCGAFMEDMRASNGTKSWEDVWADLGWVEEGGQKTGEERSKFLLPDFDQPLSKTDFEHRIYNCDRKFLYGFWHDCFDLKQQLFLVFVRAEPTLMGGGSAKMPPALGGKAVALVWRDPTASNENNAPHQTRILFYRQFD